MAWEAVERTEAAVADAKERAKTATGQAGSLLKRRNNPHDAPTNALGIELLLAARVSLLAHRALCGIRSSQGQASCNSTERLKLACP